MLVMQASLRCGIVNATARRNVNNVIDAST